LQEIYTRVSVPAVAAAAMIASAAMADVAPELLRPPPPPPQPAKVVKTGYRVTEIAKGLDHPWSMAFLPDGSLLVTERVGRLRLIKGGLALYRGDKFPAWQGDLFVGALAFKHLRRVHLDPLGNVADQEELLNDLHWRIRDVRAAPDGFLYVCTDEADGRVLRLEPPN